MNYSVLLVATGKYPQHKKGYQKIFHSLKDGKTVLERILSIFNRDDRCKQVVIITNEHDITRIVRNHEDGRVVSVNGGKTRAQSVMNGLMAVSEEVVLIHDASRPWIEKDNIDHLLDAMTTEKAACLVVKQNTSLKEVTDGYIKKTIDRSQIYITQTPQAYDTSFIIDCYMEAQRLQLKLTDDSEIVEAVSDTPIKAVKGSYFNVKVNVREK